MHPFVVRRFAQYGGSSRRTAQGECAAIWMAPLLTILLMAPVTATGVELFTSINDVTHRSPSELAGSITFKITGDAFASASGATPIFVRVTLDHGATLADTLVDQSSSDPVTQNPIYLAMECSTAGGIQMVAAPTTASIVRWVQGESEFWLRFQTSSDGWLSNGSHPLPPSATNPVSLTIGISARTSDMATPDPTLLGTNLPFNTRDTSAIEGQYSAATSTLLCGDLSGSDLDTSGTESLLGFDIASFDWRADVGSGVYSGAAGNPTGISFTNDFYIARGKRRQHGRHVHIYTLVDLPPRSRPTNNCVNVYMAT